LYLLNYVKHQDFKFVNANFVDQKKMWSNNGLEYTHPRSAAMYLHDILPFVNE